MATSSALESITASAYTIPTEQPESDGTLTWDSTTITVVWARAAGETGLGYSYGHQAAAELVNSKLGPALAGRDAFAVGAAWDVMVHALRNVGLPGLGAMAISAVDIALWDLKARLLGLPLAVALDPVRDRVPIYGSGGFTSYSDEELAEQLRGWVDAGIGRVKMKVGRDPGRDRGRVAAARKVTADRAELFVDANGAYDRKQALAWACWFADAGVSWLEEPVSSDDLEGLRLLRDAAPGGLDIAAGEYGFTLPYFQRMLAAGAVDCLQADVTRCGGITGFRKVSALCDAHCLDLSAHCAPLVSTHACAAAWHFRHLEYFHDHVRIENMLFDGVPQPEPGGWLAPDPGRPGLGVEFRSADAERFRVG